MKFNEFSDLVDFDICYSGFLVGSKINSLKIYKKGINEFFYLSLACGVRRNTVESVTLCLNKRENVDQYFLYEKFTNSDFSYFSKNEIYNVSLVERSSPITRDIRSDLNLNDIKDLQAKDFKHWLDDSLDDLFKKADEYKNIISLNDTSSLRSYNFNILLLVRAMLENELSEDLIRKLSSVNEVNKSVKNLDQLIKSVYSFKVGSDSESIRK